MKKQFKSFIKCNLLILFVCINSYKASAQNYSINETIIYINNLLANNNMETEISYSNQTLRAISIQKLPTADYTSKQSININDVSNVTISDDYISVHINCSSNGRCSTHTFGIPNKMKTNSFTNFYIETGDYDIAKKISNAIRYIIEKGKKETVKNDPFAAYGSPKIIKATNPINNLRIGMSKDDVFKQFKTKPVVESIERGYNIYRVNEGEQYFLYFSNDRLVRIDKGVRSPNTIIKIE